MKILLIYPPHALQNEQKGLKGFGPPLGLMYLATILKNKGHEIKIIDMDTFNVDIESVIKIIDKDHYNHIGISVFTRTRKIPYALAEIIRNEFPDVYISFGGPHCCLLPQEAMLDCVDSVVSGESELIITKVFEERMKGIIEAPIPNHLDELPFPDRALLDHKPYGYLENIKFAKLVTSLSSSRGCPFDCSFCTRIKTMRYFRYRSPKNIVKEIKEIEKQGFNGIWIIDDNFTALPERAIRVAELIKQNNIKMDFGYQGRFLPHKTMWKKLSQNGFCQTFAGIEHIKPEIVRYFNKYHRPNKWKNIVENTMKIITDNNVMIGGSVILGAPQEKEEDARDLINWCYEIGIDIINTNEL